MSYSLCFMPYALCFSLFAFRFSLFAFRFSLFAFRFILLKDEFSDKSILFFAVYYKFYKKQALKVFIIITILKIYFSSKN